jgi:putative DNA primase/helicase
MVLTISGEDAISIERKYKGAWTGTLPTRIMIATNAIPRLLDASGALASRFIVLHSTESFLGREDLGLTQKLLPEAQSIFLWALEGYDRLVERGHFLQPASGREMAEQLHDLASPVAAFVRDYCTVGPECSAPIDALYEAWVGWCDDEGRKPGTREHFCKDLRSVVPKLNKRKLRGPEGRVPTYEGIALGAEAEGTAVSSPEWGKCEGIGCPNYVPPGLEMQRIDGQLLCKSCATRR